MRPRLSVITVCRNSDETIETTLKSVASQSYPEIEHVIVDGGSTDGTLHIVQACARPGYLLRSEQDRGIYDAMNKGLRLATGDYVVFLNSDDFYTDANAVSQVMNCFDTTRSEVVFGDIAYVRRDAPHVRTRSWQSGRHDVSAFTRGWAPPHTAFFIRRDCMLALGGFDLAYRLASDFDLMFRALYVRQFSWSHLPREIVHMRTGGATNKNARNILNQNLEILRSLRMHGVRTNPITFFARKTALKIAERLRGMRAAHAVGSGV